MREPQFDHTEVLASVIGNALPRIISENLEAWRWAYPFPSRGDEWIITSGDVRRLPFP